MNNLIDKKKVKKFLETHRDINFSAAKFEYTLYLTPELQQMILQISI